MAGEVRTIHDVVESERTPVSERPEPQGDLTLFVPEGLTRVYDRRRAAWTTVDTTAAWLIAAHLLLLLVIVGRGALFMDDLRAQGYALDQPFLSFIMGSNGTHFAPGPRVLDWFQSRLAPLEHGPAVAITLVIRLLLAVGFWRVLRRLFGPRLVTLVPFTMLLVTPALIPATTYYRQSITIVACTMFIVWAVDAHLRWVIYRHRGDLVAVGVATVLGLGFYEKAAMIPVILLALTVALFATRPVGKSGPGTDEQPGTDERPRTDEQPGTDERPRTTGRPGAVRAGLIAVGLTVVLVLIFLVIYRSGPYQQTTGGLPTVVDVLRLLRDTISRTMIPLLLGGPYHWGYPGAYVGVPLLSMTARVLCLVLVLVALGLGARRQPGRVGRALFLLVAWVVPSVTIIAVGRFNELGYGLSTAVRLWADLVPAFLLAGALAALPWRVGVHRQEPTRARPAAVATGTTGSVPPPVEITVPALAGVLVVAVVLAGSVFSSLTYASKWWDNPTGLWIANARSSLENAEPYPRMLATPMPPGIIPSFVSLVFPSDAPLLLLMRPDLRFHDADGNTRVMNPAGVRSAFRTKGLATLDTKSLCIGALPAGNAPATMTFPKPVPYASGAQLEVGLLLAEPTKVKVTVTTPDGKVLTPQRFSDEILTTGPHRLLFPLPYLKTVSSFTVQIAGTRTSCVSDAKIWVPVS